MKQRRLKRPHWQFWAGPQGSQHAGQGRNGQAARGLEAQAGTVRSPPGHAGLQARQAGSHLS